MKTITETMKKTKTAACVALLGLTLTASSWAQNSAGNADQLFRFGSSARDIAFGRAMTASAQGPSAVYWNPGLIPSAGFQEVQFFHADLIEGFQYNYLGYAHPLKSASGFGAHVFQYGTSGAEQRDSMNNKVGSFEDKQLALAVGAGTKGLLVPDLGIGASFKILQRDTAGRASSLYGLDVGFSQPFMNHKLMTGLQLSNPMTFSTGETADKLPMRTNIGVAYRIISNFVLGLQIDNDANIALGTEFIIGNILALQVGKSPNGEISFGTGVQFKKATFNFALNENTSGLGTGFLASMNYKFGADRIRIREEIGSVSVPRAIGMVRNGDWLKAKQTLEKAITLDPSNDEARILLERLKSALVALQVKRSFEEKKWKDSPSWFWVRSGVSAFMDKDYRTAQLHTVYASMKLPDSLAIKDVLSYFEKTSPVEPIPQKQKDMTPEAFLSFKRQQVEEYFKNKEFGKAIQECREVVLLEPGNTDDWQRLGSLYYAIEEKDKSLHAYENALKLSPNNEPLKKFIREKFSIDPQEIR